ncbi:MAG: EAL domain-containing protein [Pseudomonadota bacterium]
MASPPGPGPELTPAFQPILDISSGLIAGFEALARWRGSTPDRALEDPALAPHMLMRSAEALSDWRRETGRADLFANVNLTAFDLIAPELPVLIEELVRGFDLGPGQLRIEITEQAAISDLDAALEAVAIVKQAGVGLILDDFGTGHSSFAWLADLPADGLKIDHELTARLGQPRADTIMEAITLLAARLGMTATAEGVETREAVKPLRALGFQYVQGFAFGRPMTTSDAAAYLKA